MTVPDIVHDRGVWTVPNAISFARLLCIPVFLWLLLSEDRGIEAAFLLALLGATDWVDGYIARHFDQGSEFGKVLDPVADRVLLIAGAVGLLLSGSVPIWVGVLILGREALISIATVGLAAVGVRRIEVQWVGKAGALALMFALPGFLLVDSLSASLLRDFLVFATWCFTIGGLGLSYYAAFKYVPLARQALGERKGAGA
ncbi:MAG: CDP-alcohol phosphatidyltransferase family protein [Acidimicrobiia bacterium]|nr:CDP-alcohol phosphatidyltransferase family protein [Acidimicrobiia bacterium]